MSKFIFLKKLRPRGKTSRGCCTKMKQLVHGTGKNSYNPRYQNVPQTIRTYHIFSLHSDKDFFSSSREESNLGLVGASNASQPLHHIVQTSFAITTTFFFKATIIFYPINGFLSHLRQGANLALFETSIQDI
jgi:hypothetical protein